MFTLRAMLKTWIVTFFVLSQAVSTRAQVQLTQIVSRENAAFDGRGAVVMVGRDRRVYLSNQQSPGFVLRFERDGSGKIGGTVVYALVNATANTAGVIAQWCDAGVSCNFTLNSQAASMDDTRRSVDQFHDEGHAQCRSL